MRFGVRQPGGSVCLDNYFDWSLYRGYLASQPIGAIAHYGLNVMAMLKQCVSSDAVGGGGGDGPELLPGGVQRTEVLFDHPLQAVLARIGFVHLVTRKVAEAEGQPSELFAVGTCNGGCRRMSWVAELAFM